MRPLPGLMLACLGTYSSMVYTNAANTTMASSYFTLDVWGEYRMGRARWFSSGWTTWRTKTISTPTAIPLHRAPGWWVWDGISDHEPFPATNH